MNMMIPIEPDHIYFAESFHSCILYNNFTNEYKQSQQVIVLQFPTGIQRNYFIVKFDKLDNKIIYYLEDYNKKDDIIVLEFTKILNKNTEFFYMSTSNGYKNVTKGFEIEYKVTNKCDGIVKKGYINDTSLIKMSRLAEFNELYNLVNNGNV
jgi:hypothetical protein